MINSKEVGISLVVAMHTALGAIAAGKTRDALIYALAGAGCYLIILCTLWIGERFFPNTEKENTKDEKKNGRDEESSN